MLIKYMGGDFALSPEQLAEIRQIYGSDNPPLQRYFTALTNTLTGDFGYSIHAGVKVTALIGDNILATFRLAGLGFLFALIFSLALSFLSYFSPFAWLRRAITMLPSLFIAIPVFWLGIMLIQIFSFRFRLVPVINPGPWIGLILPIATLAVPVSAPITQILMRNIDDVMTRPFVVVARAKGASLNWVFWRHVITNASFPVLTICGMLFGELLAGAVVTETVFGLNGIGRITESAVATLDVAVLQAVVLLSAATFVSINLIVDLLYPLLDPRLRKDTKAA
ncbi:MULTISPECIES: ABC transporter permease [Paenochrobactrum]|uniref:ABC transporter permease n=1 Tax=Paenochrobactrum pullorum TaxID=1324351 RepID=UPI0035BBDD33